MSIHAVFHLVSNAACSFLIPKPDVLTRGTAGSDWPANCLPAIISPQAFASLAELFSRRNWLKSKPLARFPFRDAFPPNRAARYFQSSFRRLRLAGILLLAQDRPVPQIGGSRLDPAAKMLFAVRSDSFSPQGVRGVGPPLFESLILEVFRERRSCLLGRPFSSGGMAQRLKRLAIEDLAFLIFAHRIRPLGSYFQTRPMASGANAL